MRLALHILSAAALVAALPGAVPAQAPPGQDGVFMIEYTNPGLNPSHWVLTLHRDGSGHFHAQRGNIQTPAEKIAMDVGDEDRDVRLTKDFTAHVFDVAEQHNWFNEVCQSKAKVAFQGWKKISYSGPEGRGSCTFNYSKDKQIQSLGESLMGVAQTLHEGARLELLLQHDRLGLDREMEFISDSAKDGRLQQICTIRDILQRLADDEELLERVRKRARNLLEKAGS
jgi:hypothetical protein